MTILLTIITLALYIWGARVMSKEYFNIGKGINL